MDYSHHYSRLISRACNRVLSEYTEMHHVIPRCVGGLDNTENIVALTPEEHFVAHQFLIKIYPDEHKLVYAAHMMTVASGVQRRSNKRYGWLKRKYAEACRLRTGDKNSQFETIWIHSVKLRQSKKIKRSEIIPADWKAGRVMNFDKITKLDCKWCGNGFRPSGKNQTCCSISCGVKHSNDITPKKHKLAGREQAFLDSYARNQSMNKALKEIGCPGSTGYYYRWAKKVLSGSRLPPVPISVF